MKIIGLTGGIGVGKSTVSAYLKQKNFTIVDADQIAHDITKPGMCALSDIRKAFGDKVFNEDGSLNRKALASIAFSSDEKHTLLESIITNKVIENIKESLDSFEKAGTEVVVLDAPLLFETSMDKYCNEVVLVTANIDNRVERVKARDGSSREDVLVRINNQMAEDIKIKKADYIVNNDGNLKELYIQLDKIFEVEE